MTKLLKKAELDELMGIQLELKHNETGETQPVMVKRISEKCLIIRNGAKLTDQKVLMNGLHPLGLPNWILQLPGGYTGIDLDETPEDVAKKKAKNPKGFQKHNREYSLDLGYDVSTIKTPQAAIVLQALIDFAKQNNVFVVTDDQVREIVEKLKVDGILKTKQDSFLIFKYYLCEMYKPKGIIR